MNKTLTYILISFGIFVAGLFSLPSYAFLPKLAFWSMCSQFQIVQSVTNNSNSLASLPVTLASANKAGDLIVVAVVGYRSGTSFSVTVTDTAGNTYYATNPIGTSAYDSAVQIFYAQNIVAAGAGTNTITATNNDTLNAETVFSISAIEYSGAATSSVIDIVAGQQVSSATPSTGNLTTSSVACPDLVVSLISGGSQDVSSAGAGFISRFTMNPTGVAFHRAILEDNSPNGTKGNTTVNPSATFAGSVNGKALAVAFRNRGSRTPTLPSKIAFTTSAINPGATYSCLGPITIQSQTAGGVATAVQTPVTLNLSKTEGTLYTTSTCSFGSEVTSYTLTSGSQSTSFYLIANVAATNTITATPTNGWAAINQNETITPANFTWTGGVACDGMWNTAACWQGTAVPTGADTVYFDSNCSLNCSATLPNTGATAVDILNMKVGYNSSITQGNQVFNINTINISSGTLNQGTNTINLTNAMTMYGGTFNGSASAFNLNTSASYNGLYITAGNFNAGSGTITTKATGAPFYQVGGVFNDGTGTFAFVPSFGNAFIYALGGTNSFYDVTVNSSSGPGGGGVWNGFNSTFNITHNLTLNNFWEGETAFGLSQVNLTGSVSGTSGFFNENVVLTPGVDHNLGSFGSFGNLTMDNSGNSANNTITFKGGGSYTISLGVTLKGNSTNTLKLRSDNPGTQWNMNAYFGDITIGPYVDIKDSNNNSGHIDHSGANYVDSGNNSNWTFP